MQPDTSIAQYLTLATELLKNGQAEEAFAHLEKLVTDVPDLAIGWYLLGHMALSIGDAETAIPMLEKAASLDLSHVESQLDLCLAYAHAGRTDDALHLYQALLPQGFAVTSRLPAELRNALEGLLPKGGAA